MTTVLAHRQTVFILIHSSPHNHHTRVCIQYPTDCRDASTLTGESDERCSAAASALDLPLHRAPRTGDGAWRALQPHRPWLRVHLCMWSEYTAICTVQRERASICLCQVLAHMWYVEICTSRLHTYIHTYIYIHIT